MIHTLPAEITLAISSHLEFKDKINLISTCRKLNCLISESNLYEKLDLSKNEEYARNMIQKVKNHQVNGNQVKTLKVNMIHLDDESYSALSTVFPNVSRIKDVNGRYGLGDWLKAREKYSVNPMLEWKNTIETYFDSSDWCEVWLALESNVFPSLTMINIGRSRMLINKNEFDMPRLLSAINNAPMLTTFILSKCEIDFDFLEELHANCVHIRNIKLDRVLIMIDNNSLPQHIAEAKFMMKFELRATVFDKNGLFFDYVLRKYPNLQHLDLDLFYSRMIKVRLDYLYHHMIDKHELVESRLNDLKLTQEMHIASASHFLSNLPKSLKILKLGDHVFENIFEPLYRSGVPLAEIDIRYYFESTSDISSSRNQFNYLKKIASLKTLAIPFDVHLQKCIQGSVSNTITKLSIRVNGDGCCLKPILSMFPSLQNLHIDAKYHVIDGNDGNDKETKEIYPNLRSLSIECRNNYTALLDYLKAAAPSLQRLDVTLSIDEESDARTHRLDLSNWSLKNINISFSLNGFDERFIIADINIENTTRRFMFKCSRSESTLLSDNYLKHSLLITAKANIVFDIVRNVKIAGYSIKKVGHDIIID